MIRFLTIAGLVAFIGYIILKRIVDNIKIKLDFKNVDLSKSIKLILGGEAVLKTDIEVAIVNRNRFSIPISDLNIKVYHNKTLVAETDEVSKSIFIIPKDGSASFVHGVDILLVQSFFDAVQQLKADEALLLDYKIKGRLFKIPVTFENSFEFIKK